MCSPENWAVVSLQSHSLWRELAMEENVGGRDGGREREERGEGREEERGEEGRERKKNY